MIGGRRQAQVASRINTGIPNVGLNRRRGAVHIDQFPQIAVAVVLGSQPFAFLLIPIFRYDRPGQRRAANIAIDIPSTHTVSDLDRLTVADRAWLTLGGVGGSH